MTMLKPLTVAILSVVALSVIEGSAFALSQEKAAMEAKCKDWKIIDQSESESLEVEKNGKKAMMFCQEGFIALLQACTSDEKLMRFRCEK